MVSTYNYQIQVFGDSIMWGQGLLPTQKMAYLLKLALEKRNKDLKIRILSNAHSGAIIGTRSIGKPKYPGEVPNSYPTILSQVDSAADKEKTNLILVNGGINDVDVTNILNPLTTKKWLQKNCKEMCHDRMKTLLQKILKNYPDETNVVVTGYFQIVSMYSVLSIKLWFWLEVLGLITNPLLPPIAEFAIPKLARNSKIFVEEANKQLALTVKEVNSKFDNKKRILFADPKFGSKNAVLAPNSFLFDLTTLGYPKDPMKEVRKKQCPKTGKWIKTKSKKCLVASAGHPNPKGEKQYTEQIFKVLPSDWVTSG